MAKTEAKLKTLLKVKQPPEFLLLHVGGNDLGFIPIKQLKVRLEDLIKFVVSHMPAVVLIWSEILPREWGEGNNGLESARKRFNSYAAKLCKEKGGFYLRHKNIPFSNEFFEADGVHLNILGNQKLLRNIQFGVSQFLQGIQPWFE